MNIRSSSYHPSKFNFGLQPAMAWMAILGFVFFSALCILVHAGSILRIAFPFGAFAVGVFLYFRYPILYLGFTWWVWFLTPLIRRLVDYHSGWQEQSWILLAPFLVTMITFLTFLQNLPRAFRQGGMPFILAFIAVIYSLLVGLINATPNAVVVPLLNWLTPILLGFHLFANWRDYPKISQNIQRTFSWGVLVTGAYGIVQYLIAPQWDRFWIISSAATVEGIPEPLGIRVFSTMNSAGPFSFVMMAGLLLLFNSKGALRFPASGVGYLAFLLSLVRSAWLGWAVGFLTLVISLKAKLQMRLMITILLMAVCVLPLTMMEPFSRVINARIESLYKPKNDISYNARTETYDKSLNIALTQGLGVGMGTVDRLSDVALDSGVLETLFTFGWFGTIPYLSGVFLLMFNLFRSSVGKFDSFAIAVRAICTGSLVQIFLGNVFIGIDGAVVWSFLGIGVAANKYYNHLRSAEAEKPAL